MGKEGSASVGGQLRWREGDTQLTVGVAVDVSLGVGLPEDAVTPGWNVGADLAGGGRGEWEGVRRGFSNPPPTPTPPS